jgi:hypothetical protein
MTRQTNLLSARDCKAHQDIGKPQMDGSRFCVVRRIVSGEGIC